MGLPAFRFIAASADNSDDVPSTDQFWRDVEASERLVNAAAAEFYLRELCRARAVEVKGELQSADDVLACRAYEQDLQSQIRDRGFRISKSGP